MTESAINSIINNSLPLNETTSGDISTSPDFIGKLIKQTFANTILPMITSVIPLKNHRVTSILWRVIISNKVYILTK